MLLDMKISISSIWIYTRYGYLVLLKPPVYRPCLQPFELSEVASLTVGHDLMWDNVTLFFVLFGGHSLCSGLIPSSAPRKISARLEDHM